jgi:DNA repair exonuclease SbcCD ATPase subunit
MILLIIQIYFSRHYYADSDKARREIERLIKEGEWDTKELTEMRENLLEVLQIKHDPVSNEVIVKKLSALEELEKTYYEKLDKLENLDSKLENLDSKLGKLDKLEKLEKLLEEIHKNKN